MKDLKRYYRQVASWLPCGGRTKREMMARIRTTVDAYVQEHPATDFAAIQEHFGTPQQIASAFVNEMETEELLNTLRVRRKIVSIVVAVAFAAVALLGSTLAIALVDEISASNGYFVTDQIVQ